MEIYHIERMIFLRIRSLSRKIALLLILALLCLSCTALAEDSAPQYAATKDFVAVLEANDLKYIYKGIDDDTDENIRVSFSDDDYDSIVLNVFFSKDSDAVYIRGWNLLTTSAGTNYVLSTLNQLNHQYKYVKFTFDESDNTVYVQMDGYLSPDHPGYATLQAAISNLNTLINSAPDAATRSAAMGALTQAMAGAR